jgi:hypothetical protein
MVVNFRARGISRGAQAGPDTHVKLKKKYSNLIIILYMIEYESLYAKKIEHPCLVGINMYLKWELTCT